jgi:hypothetical protein
MTQNTFIPLKFSYPRRGLVGEFNTFRLGRVASVKYPPGAAIALVDSRSGKVLKHATVTEVYVGALSAMAAQHAHQAHNWKEHPPEQQAELLIASMLKRYPPGRADHNSICSVIYLRENPDG